MNDRIFVAFSLPDDSRVTGQANVHIPGTASTLHLAFDVPDQVEFGQEFAIKVIASTDEPITDPRLAVSVQIDERFVVEAASAPGWTCEVLEEIDNGGVVEQAPGALCTGTELADSTTLTIAARVDTEEPGEAFIDAALNAGNFTALADSAITIAAPATEPGESGSNPPGSSAGPDGGSDSPTNEGDRNLANTGTPAAALVGIGAALLAAAAGLTFAFRRRRLSRTTTG